jgi:hypothetical protein
MGIPVPQAPNGSRSSCGVRKKVHSTMYARTWTISLAISPAVQLIMNGAVGAKGTWAMSCVGQGPTAAFAIA